MWANTSPHGGLIVIGIADKGAIIGCKSLEADALNRLEKTGYERCPDAHYETKRVPVTNDRGEHDFLLLMRVLYHETKLVETCDHRAFVRIGDSKIELRTDDEKRQLRIDKGEVQHEQEPCVLAFPEDFDMELVNRWAANVKKMRGLRSDIAIEKLMQVFHLGQRKSGKFIPNIACMLLFANDPVGLVPGCRVVFMRFDGTQEGTGAKRNTVKEEDISGCIPTQIDQTAKILLTQIRKFSGLGKDNRFHTTPEYPEAAWYEALVNACVHRSYHLKNMKIFVKMFDDRLEIDSPGPFPPLVTPANIYDTQHSRNPFVMDALAFLGLVKGVNEGVRRMRDTMLEMKLPAPEFSEMTSDVNPAKVKVVLRNNIAFRKVWLDSDIVGIIGASIFVNLSEKEKMILNYLAIHHTIKVNQTQVLTGHTWHTCKKILDRMTAQGILSYVRKPGTKVDRQAYYKLSDSRPMNGHKK